MMRIKLLLPLALLVLTQGCSPFSTVPGTTRTFKFDFDSMSAAVLQPESDKLDAECMSKTDYDACLFQKNPVAHTKAPLATLALTQQNLGSSQIYGVKLTGLKESSALANETFRIETVKSGLVPTQNKAALKLNAQNDVSSNFSAITTYYWLNRATEYLSAHAGYFPASGRNIRVVIDDNFAGWSSKTNSLHLKTGDNPMAWSPELAIHFLGLANLHYASNGATDLPHPSKHRDCGVTIAGCCQSSVGCSKAIANGVGDYFVALIFPNQPVVGETWANRADGINSCGVDRNLEKSAQRTATQAFDACTARPGDASVMGNVYASIWWEVRKAESPKGVLEIDALFMYHLADLNGVDDFRTALAKIRVLDTQAFGGRHIPAFEAQFTARGL